mgnify:CR=1 FL=1
MMWLLQRLTGSKSFWAWLSPTATAMAGVTSPKQGVCGQNAEGTDDKIRIPAGNKHGIFSGCAEVSPGFEHGSGCGCVGADGIQFTVGQLLFTEAGSHKTADSAALTVNYYDFHKSSI